MTSIQRGDVWLVNFDPAIGAEIQKTRPAMVISNDISNQSSSTITLLPVTDRGEKVHPFEVDIPLGLGSLIKPSKLKCQQIRTVDKRRLVRFLGVLPDQIIHSAERALCLHLALDPSTHQ